MLDQALKSAVSAFEAARPLLGRSNFGVDTQAYGNALALQPVAADYWGETLVPHLEVNANASGTCGHYIAFTHRPEQSGRIDLVLCPLFFAAQEKPVRRLTLLHEMVHVVAGPDECRAMAYAALIEEQAFGRYTPDPVYWRANHCQKSDFSLPN